MKKTKTGRIPEELLLWIEEIKKVYEKERGFIPESTDIMRSMVLQFRGKYLY